jgi:hypothetical protein
MIISKPKITFTFLNNATIFLTTTQDDRSNIRGAMMPKYIIEREIPGAGSLTQDELKQISQKSCCILDDMGPKIQWLESFVTPDKIYCVYIAPDEKTIRTHAERGEFPANSIAKITTMIDPTMGE